MKKEKKYEKYEKYIHDTSKYPKYKTGHQKHGKNTFMKIHPSMKL